MGYATSAIDHESQWIELFNHELCVPWKLTSTYFGRKSVSFYFSLPAVGCNVTHVCVCVCISMFSSPNSCTIAKISISLKPVRKATEPTLAKRRRQKPREFSCPADKITSDSITVWDQRCRVTQQPINSPLLLPHWCDSQTGIRPFGHGGNAVRPRTWIHIACCAN